MYKIKIITVGKIKHQWLSLALKDYEERLKTNVYIEWILFKDEKKWIKYLEKEKDYYCLDLNGEDLSSIKFSNIILKNKNISIIIGPHMGIPLEIKKKSIKNIKLSSLTFTHQMTRIILLEQIYRSFEISKKSGYHK